MPQPRTDLLGLSALGSAFLLGFLVIDSAFDWKTAANGDFQAADDYYDTILVAPQVNLGVVIAGGLHLLPLLLVTDTVRSSLDGSSKLWRMWWCSLSAVLLYLVLIIPRYRKILKHDKAEELKRVTKNWWLVLGTRVLIAILLGWNIGEFVALLR